MSRPYKGSFRRVSSICRAIRYGASYSLAAQCGGVHRNTLYQWRKSDTRLAEVLARAEAYCAVRMWRRIVDAAEAGEWEAALFWLEDQRPDLWIPAESQRGEDAANTGHIYPPGSFYS